MTRRAALTLVTGSLLALACTAGPQSLHPAPRAGAAGAAPPAHGAIVLATGRDEARAGRTRFDLSIPELRVVTRWPAAPRERVARVELRHEEPAMAVIRRVAFSGVEAEVDLPIAGTEIERFAVDGRWTIEARLEGTPGVATAAIELVAASRPQARSRPAPGGELASVVGDPSGGQ